MNPIFGKIYLTPRLSGELPLGMPAHKGHNYLGLVYLRRGQEALADGHLQGAEDWLKLAERRFNLAIEAIEPGKYYIWPYLNLAGVYLLREQYPQAKELLAQMQSEHAMDLKRSDVRAKYEELTAALPPEFSEETAGEIRVRDLKSPHP